MVAVEALRSFPPEISNNTAGEVLDRNPQTDNLPIPATLKSVLRMIEIKRTRLNRLPTIQEEIAAQEDLDRYIARHANVLFG